MLNQNEKDNLIVELEQKGISSVEESLAQGLFNSQKKAIAENWVEAKRQEQNLSHKKQSLNLQRESNKIGWLALCISCVALLISILVAVFK